MAISRRAIIAGSGILAMDVATGGAKAERAMKTTPFAAAAPVSVSRVGIKARDGEALAGYYKHVVGLEEIARRPGAIVLGAAGKPLFEIEAFSGGKPDDPKSAGLYHTAFLLPERADLARWTRRAIDEQIAVVGASDHLVSEAIYLTDPEGNGIEIYADRAQDAWPRTDGAIRMATDPLDVKGLLGEIEAGDAGWQGAPEGSMIGHVHLRVGSASEAEQWWNRELGFETMLSFGGSAVFLSTGGYHHHVGANNWQSRGAQTRDGNRTGLSFVEFVSKDATEEREYVDPWGTAVRVVPKAA